MRREKLGIPFFAAAAAGALAAILTSHPSSADVVWLIAGAVAGADTAIRFARKHYRLRKSGAPSPLTDRQRVRAVAFGSACLGVFLNAVLPQKAWLPIFAYALMASSIIAAYYAWFVAAAGRR